MGCFLRKELEENIDYYLSRCHEADVTALKESIWSEAYDVRCLLWCHARSVKTRLWNWAFQLKHCLWYHARAVALAMMSRNNSLSIAQNHEERYKSAIQRDTMFFKGAIRKEIQLRKEQNLHDIKCLTKATDVVADHFGHLEPIVPPPPVPPPAPRAPPVVAVRKPFQEDWFWLQVKAKLKDDWLWSMWS